MRYDIADVVADVAADVGRGSDAGQRVLESLDLPTSDTLNGMLEGDDYRYVGFSARTKIEALYNLAEAREAGEGARFLAKLHARIGTASAVVDQAPALQDISRRFTAEQLRQDLVFAEPRVLGDTGLLKPLPVNVENAVDLLARATAPEEFATIVDLVERHFRLRESPREVINSAIMQSVDRRQALGLMIRAHGPPPSAQEATRRLLLDATARSGILATDERTAQSLRELADEPLPQRLRELRTGLNELPSRINQSTAVADGRAISRPLGRGAERAATRAIIAARGVESLLAESGDGGGPSYTDTRRAHADYSGRVHSGPRGVPRTYARAIRSARAGRGIAVGSGIVNPEGPLERAFWVPSVKDSGFGRIVVRMRGGDRLVATRHLFADSFEAAVSLLWGDHGEASAFRDGEIVILMSMDPESSVNDEARRAEAEAEARHLLEDLERGSMSQADALRTVESLVARATARGIVIHPALHGRELAWSAARADFWFNALDQVSREGAMLNGGRAMPSRVREAWTGSADTWQFYERDGRIVVAEASGPGDSLSVRSLVTDTGREYSAESHFAVSLFAYGERRPTPAAVWNREDGVWRLIGEEGAVQPMLDWAIANHPDFMRLNDFSEALSILRWVARSAESLAILEPHGAPVKIATPDRVFIGEVRPYAGERR